MVEECLAIKDIKNPIRIFRKIATKNFIRIHGPEHHILDGACFLTAFYNAGGKIDLQAGLERIVTEGQKMPGATCGLWGVCGSVTSVGAALAFIDGTGPLTTDASWGNHMQFTAKALQRMSETGGPRCCKRDAFISLTVAIEYAKEQYGILLEMEDITCGFSAKNAQCIKERCPYYPKRGA
ncbi:MAG: hypothetical protein E7269_06880 [Lachnospiraceae bacterium]|nr:hypothetical protein [Lachnospiraceae bacterium]